jgi:putative heme-binding domain-containing protein
MNPPLHPSQEGNLQPMLQTKLPSSEGPRVGSRSRCTLKRTWSLSMDLKVGRVTPWAPFWKYSQARSAHGVTRPTTVPGSTCQSVLITICLISVLMTVLLTPAKLQAQEANNNLAVLVQLISETSDPQFQLDLLKGLSEGLKGRRQVPMPQGWEPIELKLGQSPNTEIRALTQSLSLTFGSTRALAALRKTLTERAAELSARRMALEALLGAKDSNLAPLLQQLLTEAPLRAPAVRALAAYEDSKTPPAILSVYQSLNTAEKKDALNTLASRITFAKFLLSAVGQGSIPAKDLTADVVRQLRNLKNAEIDRDLQKVWGVARDSSADKQQEIAKYRAIYRAGGSTPGDASRGRAVFTRICAQCHMLFDAGGKVGPDLTGSNRGDLEYILQNMVDPNAVIPNEYRTSMIETKDDRIITGIASKQDEKSVTILTANETLIVPRNEIKSSQQSDVSMMPEGLMQGLSDQEVRDLIYYLSRPGQAPLMATPEPPAK